MFDLGNTTFNYVGQIAVFDLRDQAAPCYACFVPEDTPKTVDHCSGSGVLASLTGTIGSMQATEVISLIVSGASRHPRPLRRASYGRYSRRCGRNPHARCNRPA
ncbi:MAG: hypothetical protein EBT13_16650 [Rhodobacteraceae bacterium]|nr:hypothetical protein [Paracoccaceae bacterium]